MPQPDHHPTVLVLGAEPGLVGEFLLAQSCPVVHASTGADAVALARRHRPGLVVMDLDLEHLDPYEIAVDLDTMPETRDAEIVAIVTEAQDDEAIRQRCSGRLVRPITEGALAAVLAPCLARLARDLAAGAPAARPGEAQPGGHADDLRQRIERLEQELARTQQALAGLYEQQVSLRRVAHLAQEMAQPMTLVMGYAEMLPADLANLGAARSDCAVIAEQVKRMAHTLGLLRRLSPPTAPTPPGRGSPGLAEKGL